MSANANAFLPFKVATKKAEHIAAYFDPFEAGSFFAGVGAADVHNRDPRDLPLLTRAPRSTATACWRGPTN